MIIKGKSRGGPKQLATHLLRADTNERVEVVELHSTATNLADAFKEWQIIAEGTQGTRGLYHANIDPDARYTMTAEQWTHAVNVLERELGLDGQPRAVVLHKKHGRQHIHVVWQRTDINTMTMISDSHNYRAHERASLALETAFGHETVPGKHAKRDDDQPVPIAEINHAEWQQGERAGIDPRAFKDQITALYQASDTGSAFQKALDDKGLLIAQGDRRDFVIVGHAGEIYSLARQIRGVTAKDLRAFMADLNPTMLPTIAEAKILQRERPPPEIIPAEKPPAAEPAPPVTDQAGGSDASDALQSWHTEDMRQLAEYHMAERQRLAENLDREAADKLAQSDTMRETALKRYDSQAERKGFARLVDKIAQFITPALAAQRQARRDEALAVVMKALERERVEEIARLEAVKVTELAELADRHVQQIREREAQFTDERARRMRGYEDAKRFAAHLDEQRQREQATERTIRAGPEPPTSAR